MDTITDVMDRWELLLSAVPHLAIRFQFDLIVQL